ncbi:HisA/HisF-related TIM barrel protein [Streptomyces sp. enrichment culture]|uniref:HisA/HisF-related TIM barrel protein n=1 Tax=Streptomyces sp. enrichment culture TaxID=1795815 RepID=UPI003F56FEBA
MADDCRRAEAAGCAGVDLLAYRATDADPLDLVRAARAATTGRLVVAGSITSTDRIQALASAGADAFTIGSAAFGGPLQPHAGTLRSQLAPVVGLWQEHRGSEPSSQRCRWSCRMAIAAWSR